MRDFLNNNLVPNDAVAFTTPLTKGLTKGYVVSGDDHFVKIRFWVNSEWNGVEVSRKAVVKIHIDLQ